MTRTPPRVLLAGLGHAHLFVLEAVARGRMPPCELVVCTGEARHVYSGMVPGWLAGRYTLDELSLDVAAIVRRAGGTLRPAHVTAIDPSTQSVTLVDRSTECYDFCSIAVGSRMSGLSIPGAAQFALAVKPLASVQDIGDRVDALARGEGGDVVVVGGGVAGVEIALAIRSRAERSRAGARVHVALVSRDLLLAPDRGVRVSRKLAQTCLRRGVELLLGTTPTRVSATHLALREGQTLRERPAALVVWATGADAAPWLRESGLPVDGRGFLLVDDHLQSVGDSRVFVAGDSAALASALDTPKSGVFAVRMGPHLVRSLAHALGGGAGRSTYHPQRRTLALINTGDARAIVSWGPVALEGAWAMRWKDWIDRRFIARFAALAR